MSHFGNSTEYALHCLIWLAQREGPASTRDLADLQGISPSFLAKIFPKLEKAGILVASEGARGGYRLRVSAGEITVLSIVEAVEGHKPLFECNEIRGRCAIFQGSPPPWSTDGLCGIHALMLRAERRMKDELSNTTLADLVHSSARKAPPEFSHEVKSWFAARSGKRLTPPDT